MNGDAKSVEHQSPLCVQKIDRIKHRLSGGGALTIIGLGDSLTYGWQVRKGFFKRFIEQIKMRFPSNAITAHNAGVPGDTACQGLARAPQMRAHHPDLVVVQFGLNDMYQGVAVEDFEKHIINITNIIEEIEALPLLVTSTPLNWPEGLRLSQAFYDAIEKRGADHDVPCARLDLYWRRKAGPIERWQHLVHPDEVHPTDEGHALMADGLMHYLFG